METEPYALDLSIVIPAYNEERRLGPTLEAYVGLFSLRYGGAWELLVVLNGCTDGTEGLVDGYRERCPQVRSLVYAEPLGKGGAVREGLRRARGTRVAFVDADNMVGPGETAKLIEALDSSDVAIGWRRSADHPQPLARRVASLLVRLWTRWYLGLPFHDTQCGAKAMTREAASAILLRLSETGWALDLDIIMSARSLGLRVVEAPVAWRHVVEGSKLRLRQAGWEFFMASRRLRRRARG